MASFQIHIDTNDQAFDFLRKLLELRKFLIFRDPKSIAFYKKLEAERRYRDEHSPLLNGSFGRLRQNAASDMCNTLGFVSRLQLINLSIVECRFHLQPPSRGSKRVVAWCAYISSLRTCIRCFLEKCGGQNDGNCAVFSSSLPLLCSWHFLDVPNGSSSCARRDGQPSMRFCRHE
jgi:hypothetical protein